MTIETIVRCDGRSCCNECEIEDAYDSSVSAAGWHTDPHDGFNHYCPRCWPVVKKELEEEDC
ncbi:hypothetical protein [Halomonas rhizosphaerae]|uniref:Uncharacterized protein n=1 Tax=Halomonas rhizosphaerae TaxID=3043296 RepID=A0ABT6UXC9_9GAMM|nr:hypothetical protein [Halomonas rhizosphaerae]MDI5890641.1 hypothetical protein [Halomonas rhizosphaerae]